MPEMLNFVLLTRTIIVVAPTSLADEVAVELHSSIAALLDSVVADLVGAITESNPGVSVRVAT